MKKVLVSCILILTICGISHAQRYNFAGGIRLGTEIGFTLKYRIAEKLTLEGIVQSPIRDRIAVTSLLLEKHNSILTKGLNIYLGGGVQKGWVLDDQATFDDPFGIVGIIGAEISFARLNVSYDIKPAVNLVGGRNTLDFQTGLSVRYILSKDKLFERDSKDRDFKKKEKRKRKKKKEKAKKKKWKQKIKDRFRKKNG